MSTVKNIRFFPRGMKRALVALVAAVFVPVFALQVYTYIQRYQEAVDDEVQADREMAHSVGLALQAFFRDVGRQELALGEGIAALYPSNPAAASRLLGSSVAEYPALRSLTWAGPDGSVIASTDPNGLGVNLSDRPYFKDALSGNRPVVSDLLMDRLSGEPAIIIARSIRNQAGAVEGIIIASIDPDKLGALVLAIEHDEASRFTVFDRSGRLVYRWPEIHPTWDERYWPDKDPLLAEAIQGREASGTQRSPVSKEDSITVRMPLPALGWVVGASRPVALVTGPLLIDLAVSLALLLAIAAASLLAASAISRSLTRPLARLQAHAVAVGQGDLSHRAEIRGVAELKELGGAFNQMAANLRTARQELERTNAELEDRVRRRTAQVIEQARSLEAFFSHAITPLVFLDPKFNFIRVNEAYARACVRQVADFPGHNHFEFYPHAENQSIFENVVRTKTMYTAAAKPFSFPDHPEWGVTYWDWTLTPITDDAGQVQFLVFALQDVTERVEAERRKNVTNALLELYARKTSRKAYLDSVTELIRSWSGCRCLGIRIKDSQNRIPYESFVGFSEDFWKLENWLSLDADTCACVRVIKGQPEAHDRAAMTPRGSFRCDDASRFVETLTPEERKRYRGNCILAGFKSLAIIPVHYRDETHGAIHLADERPGLVPQARIEFVESMAPLIGEALQRFNVEEELARYREHLEELVKQRTGELEAANRQLQREMAEREEAEAQIRTLARFPAENPNPVCRITADLVLEYANASAKPLIDVWKCQVGHRVPTPIEKMVAQAVNSGKVSEVELDAGDRIFSLVFAPIVEAGYVNVYGRDVTERRRAEEALKRAADDLARSNRDLEQFAYIASHDLQEPLRTVAGYLQLLERRYKDRLDADANDFINFAVDGAARMQTLINDLLAYSRVGTKGHAAAPVNCEEILARALANLRSAVEETGARITHDPLPTVSGDAPQLVQLFQNLIGNGIKFRGKAPPEIHVSAAPDDGHWKFSIADNGIGIEPRYADRIFIIFQRLHTRDKYPGTGIGLAICKRIVERHGGKIWFQPRPGGGVTFYFTI